MYKVKYKNIQSFGKYDIISNSDKVPKKNVIINKEIKKEESIDKS